MLKLLADSEEFVYKLSNAIKYIGGNISEEDLAEKRFGEVVDNIIRNGGKITVEFKSIVVGGITE